jgi:hypothetical protein
MRIGFDAPHQNFMGQIETESNCNSSVTAFDGGMGLGQFMPDTAEWMQKREKDLRDISAKPNAYNPQWSIRALILYDKWLYTYCTCPGWYFTFRGYNGGVGLLNKEIKKAGSCNQVKIEEACKRKVLQLKSGPLDMCKVNITYPAKITKAGKKYERYDQ